MTTLKSLHQAVCDELDAMNLPRHGASGRRNKIKMVEALSGMGADPTSCKLLLTIYEAIPSAYSTDHSVGNRRTSKL